jgi:hypothetical protein
MIYYFIYFYIACFGHCHLDISFFEKIQDYKVQDPEQQQVGNKVSNP